MEFLKERQIAETFLLNGKIIDIVPYGEGHINRTFKITTDCEEYILQKINSYVFPDVKGLMNNISLVTDYLKGIGVETLELLSVKTGEKFCKCEDGYYRIFKFIKNCITYQSVDNPVIFKNVGRAFGNFQNYLAEFNAKDLVEVIPDFHNTPKRYNDFLKAFKEDKVKRANTCAYEIDKVVSRADTYGEVIKGLNDGSVPVRVTHNDTKLNNILMDKITGEPRAVIDLDTIMPGSMLYDFGDAIRFGASTALEDEKDLNKVHFDINLFRVFAEGFCSSVKDKITDRERELLPYSCYLISMEIGMRFLADYLSGDVYFATAYPEHNLIRARTQFKLADEMQEQFNEMKEIIDKILG